MRPQTTLPSPFPDFATAARETLRFLRDHLGMRLWMVTRVEGDRWIVLDAEDAHYGVRPGDVLRWSDSFCYRMVQGQGPHVAPRSDEVPAYASAPIRRLLPIRAYVGVPLQGPDGSLFGTLCAVDPDPQPERLRDAEPLLLLVGRLLSTVLRMELAEQEARRRAERLEVELLRDPLTGQLNRRAWEELLAREEARCRRYGHPALVAFVDLDGLKETNDRYGHAAGDELLRRAARALQSCARAPDVVARVGGDEFALLFVECGESAAESVTARIRAALAAAGVEASVGVAARDPGAGLEAAWRHADLAMYRDKARHRRERTETLDNP